MSIEIQIACRALAEFVHREGGLSPISFSGLDPGDGTRTHQAFYKALDEYIPGAKAKSEVSVGGRFVTDDLTLVLSGRVDMFVEAPDKRSFALEVKTVGVPLSKIDDKGLSSHWAQVRLYAWLLVQNDDQAVSLKNPVQYALAYVSREDMSCRILYEEMSYVELEKWFSDTCYAYLAFAKRQRDYQDRSLESIRALRFPYPSLRDGQRQFMERVLRNLRSRTPLLVQAPTGTGKTMSTLYPAIKGLAAGLHKQIFYLTAKSSTREVAAESLRALRSAGLIIRSVNMTAKEKLCLEPDIYCDPQICPYAKNYYKNIATALDEALTAQDFEIDLILQLAGKHQVCPFELQLDIALYADIIICDYNYAFDPRVRLERFFSDEVFHYSLLIDEAHNLPDRAREMYSAHLSEKELNEAIKAITAVDKRLLGIFMPIRHYFDTLSSAIKPSSILPTDTVPEANSENEEKRLAAWPLVEDEIRTSTVMATDNFRGVRQAPNQLIQKLWYFCHQLRDLLDDIDDFQLKQSILDFYFSARYFLRVSDEFWSDRYVLTAQTNGDGLTISMLCLDSSERIVSTFRNRHSAIFFSATLTPINYFMREFCGSSYDDKPDTMVLASPFPRENLLLAIAGGVQTIFKERRNSRAELAKTIALGLIKARGNSMIFFPSYSYMAQILPLVRRNLGDYAIDIMVQTSSMSENERQAFIKRFSEHRETGRNLAAFAVLGGVFGEGIDLVGDKLKAVIVVGVGLPQISPEREILQQYYTTQNLGGFDFAYLYPGFNKVLQAAGRLIRSETDTGLILLIDQRYERPDYQMLFPDEWVPVYCKNLKELNETLDGIPRGD